MKNETSTNQDRFREKALIAKLRNAWPSLSDAAIIGQAGIRRVTSIILTFDSLGTTLYIYCDVFELDDFETDNNLRDTIEESIQTFNQVMEGSAAKKNFLVDIYGAKYMFDTRDEREKSIIPIIERVERITRNLPREGAERLKAICEAKTPLLTEEERIMTKESALNPERNPNLRDERVPWDV